MSPRAPRVLLSGVVLSQPMGGVRRHNMELLPRVARLLTERGGSLALLEGREPLPFELPPEVERLPSSVPWRPPLARATLEGRWLRKHLSQARVPFDLVHTAHLPVPRHLPVPYTLTLHDLRSLEGAHSPMSRRLIASKVIGGAVRAARCVLTVSDSVRAQLLERFGLAPDRVRVVPNAADHFAALPRAAGEGAPILFIGHIEARKNVALLVEALATSPDLPALVLAGREVGDEGERLRARAHELDVADRITWRGPFEDAELPELLSGAGCVVLPSHVEGFGIPVLEAQRAGVPVAVARTHSLTEVAGDVPTFERDDPLECAGALARALRTEPEAIERARVAAERFTWDASARAWFDAWSSALDAD